MVRVSDAQMNWTTLGGTPEAQRGLPSEQHDLLNRFPYVASPIEAFGSWRPHKSFLVTSDGLLFDMAVTRALVTSPTTSQSTQAQFDLLRKSSQLAFLIHSHQQLKQPASPIQLQEPLVIAEKDLAPPHKRDSPIHAFLRSKGGHQEKQVCPGPIHRRAGLAKNGGCFPLPSSRTDQSRAPALKLSSMSRFTTKWKELIDRSTSSVERERKKALLKEYFARRTSDD